MPLGGLLALVLQFTPGVIVDGVVGVAAVLFDLGDASLPRLLFTMYSRSRPLNFPSMVTLSLSVLSVRIIFRLRGVGWLLCTLQESSAKTVIWSELPMELITVISVWQS